MTKDEALRMALEALEQSHPEAYRHVITAIKEALSSPNGEAQPEQRNASEHLEPVAYCWKSLRTGDLFDFVENKNGDALKEQGEDFPTLNLVLLYTTPPQQSAIARTWVGLSEEEEEDILRRAASMNMAIAKTEAKLKEKNNG